jgi:hypothetical protein
MMFPFSIVGCPLSEFELVSCETLEAGSLGCPAAAWLPFAAAAGAVTELLVVSVEVVVTETAGLLAEFELSDEAAFGAAGDVTVAGAVDRLAGLAEL